MLQPHLGNIFFYDTERSFLSAFADIFDSKSYQTFATDNLYQLSRYAKTISPDVIIFNLNDLQKLNLQTLKNFETAALGRTVPIIVLQTPTAHISGHASIAHYLDMPADYNKLIDIVESYGQGNKNHEIMLLNRYLNTSDRLHRQLQQKNYNVFEVHNADAALIYLKKNHPQNIWIEYTPEFIPLRHSLPHQRIFYVDRQQDIAEIEKFLQ